MWKVLGRTLAVGVASWALVPGEDACAATGVMSTAAVGTVGCGSQATTGDFHLETTDGSGTTRDYEVIIPSPLPTTPRALTFVYHGARGTEAVAKGYGLQGASGAADSFFVFPQGIDYRGHGIGWDDSCGGYDMVFFDHMLAYLQATYCIDPTRVFAAGFSWGCDYVTGLSCCRGDRIRAIGAASCSDDFANPPSAATYIDLPCPAAGHTAVRFTFDPAGDSGYTAQDFQATGDLYRSFNSCSAKATSTTVPACVSYDNCVNRYLACSYPGLGHALPANWPNETWAFFSTFGAAAAVPALGHKIFVAAAGLLFAGLIALRLSARRRLG